MIQLPSEFRARLETFRGPLDLLLYLIKKDELDILDIPIARITEQYITYLHILKDVDPNICGEFLVMAARLMEIKSKSLLPVDLPEDEEEEMEDPRLELVLQLLEYKKYKERALVLERMAQRHGRRHRRPDPDLAQLAAGEEMSFDLGRVSVWDLLTAFQRVQMALAMRQPHRVLFEDRPIEEYIKSIELSLDASDDQSIQFETLFEDCRDRHDAVGFFLAILEMAKQGRIRFDQPEPFGDIYIQRRFDRPDESGEADSANEAQGELGAEEDASHGARSDDSEDAGDPGTEKGGEEAGTVAAPSPASDATESGLATAADSPESTPRSLPDIDPDEGPART